MPNQAGWLGWPLAQNQSGICGGMLVFWPESCPPPKGTARPHYRRLSNALARDLRGRFVPYFIRVLRTTASALFVDAEATKVDSVVSRIQVIFVTHTMLLKTMSKEVLADPALFRQTVRCGCVVWGESG